MKIQIHLGLLTATILVLIFISCSSNNTVEGGGPCDKVEISRIDSDKSHNFGEKCLSCHNDESLVGPGCFVIGGSIYDQDNGEDNGEALTNAFIHFFSESEGKGDLLYTSEVDLNGNLYSTENFELAGTYPAVEFIETGIMTYSIREHEAEDGDCNSCHKENKKMYGIK